MSSAFPEASAGAPFSPPFAGLRIAILIGDGSDEGTIALMQKVLRAIGAQTVLVGDRPGPIATTGGTHRTEHTVHNCEPNAFDAVVVPGGNAASLADEPRVVDFVGHACGLGKPVAAIGSGRAVVEASGSAGVGLVRGDDAEAMRVARKLITALAFGRLPRDTSIPA
jgi:putative intracellular protease/amidase